MPADPAGGVNWARVLPCGLLAGLVWSVLSSFVTALTGRAFSAALPDNRLAAPRASLVAFLLAVNLAEGIWSMWLYAAIRPRFGASILHSFQAGESGPCSSVTSDGNGIFYGTTAYGGPFSHGTVYKIKKDGTGFQRLHAFASGATDGSDPNGLILDDVGNLYGTTAGGGSSNAGSVFAVKVDGTDFQLLHSFAGGASDGGNPFASLTLGAFGILYGTTYFGGSANGGTIFKLRTDGTGFQLLHSFVGGAGDGRGPHSSLLLDGSGGLFGTTASGGSSNTGTVFRINTDGTGFQLLRADGTYPVGSLISDGMGVLYGMTAAGGTSNQGAVFKMKMDGTNFQILHSFGGAHDGRRPFDSLVLDRSGNLYGRTQGPGDVPGQTIFKVKTDSTEYQLLYAFVDDDLAGLGTPGPPIETQPSGPLILDGSRTLYGTISDGGSSHAGTIFSINTDGSLFQVLYSFAGFMSDGAMPDASVISDGSGYLYGTTDWGGAPNGGTVYRIRSDGTGFQLLHAFSSRSMPQTPLTLDRAGNLYGTTMEGGSGDWGVGSVFKLRTDGSDFQFLHDFTTSEESFPSSGVTLDSAGNLYGTTAFGGLYYAGVVFKVRTDGTGFEILHSFRDGDGSPGGALVLDGSGNLYGTASSGGSSNGGTIFKLRTDGTGFEVLHSFAGGVGDGRTPGSVLLDRSGNLYGTTSAGGQCCYSAAYDYHDGLGTVFSMKTDGTGFQLLHRFVGGASDGSTPTATVILDRFGNLYGTTYYGGPSNAGTVFTLRTDGIGFRVLHTFGVDVSDGKNPTASLYLNGLGDLIGTTENGGAGTFGTVFVLSIGPQHPVVTAAPSEPVRRR